MNEDQMRAIVREEIAAYFDPIVDKFAAPLIEGLPDLLQAVTGAITGGIVPFASIRKPGDGDNPGPTTLHVV